jgi:hypothetical protein
MAVRTWAPRGKTPVLRVPLTRDHLSSISGITLDGRLFLQVRPASYDTAAVVGFLRVLLRKLSGKLVVIWDGSPIHRGHEITDLLKRGAAKRFTWNSCRATLLISTRMRAFGITSSEWSWAMCAVPIWISYIKRSFERESACGTKRRSSKAVLVNVATWFSS